MLNAEVNAEFTLYFSIQPSAFSIVLSRQRPFERAHAVVRVVHLHRLLADQGHRGGGQRIAKRLLVHLLGGILAALGLGDDAAIVLAGHDRLDVHPAAVRRARHAPRLLGIAAEPADLALELAGHLAALPP